MKIKAYCSRHTFPTYHAVTPVKDSDPRDQKYEWLCLYCIKVHGWKPYMGYETHGFTPKENEIIDGQEVIYQ